MVFSPDVYPQKFKGKLVQSAINTYVEVAIPTGLAGNVASERGKKKRTIVQLLGITSKIPQFTVSGDRVLYHVASFSRTGIASISDRGVIFDYDKMYTLATNGINVQQRTEQFEFGMQGMGVLVATDNLYVLFNTVDFSAVQTLYFNLWYRYVQVTEDDYNDLIREQQSYTND